MMPVVPLLALIVLLSCCAQCAATAPPSLGPSPSQSPSLSPSPTGEACVCEASWSSSHDAACQVEQVGCPDPSCDGDSPWCFVTSPGCAEDTSSEGRIYCDSSTPVAATAPCSVTDGSAVSTTYPCACGTGVCSDNKVCTEATSTCELAPCSVTDGSAVSTTYPCACGGDTCSNTGDVCTETTSTCAPACATSPSNWTDRDGDDCEAYASNEWCFESWVDDYAVGAVSAVEACCQCGGGSSGSQAPPSPGPDPSSSPTPSPSQSPSLSPSPNGEACMCEASWTATHDAACQVEQVGCPDPSCERNTDGYLKTVPV
jgi:hypothetical protein